jgi:hypothetical protein
MKKKEKKVMRVESGRGQNEEERKKTRFAICKNVLSTLLFLTGSLALHFKDDL